VQCVLLGTPSELAAACIPISSMAQAAPPSAIDPTSMESEDSAADDTGAQAAAAAATVLAALPQAASAAAADAGVPTGDSGSPDPQLVATLAATSATSPLVPGRAAASGRKSNTTRAAQKDQQHSRVLPLLLLQLRLARTSAVRRPTRVSCLLRQRRPHSPAESLLPACTNEQKTTYHTAGGADHAAARRDACTTHGGRSSRGSSCSYPEWIWGCSSFRCF